MENSPLEQYDKSGMDYEADSQTDLYSMYQSITPDIRRLTESSNALGWHILEKLIQEKTDDNILISPFSITQCLYLLLYGAESATYQNILEMLMLSGLDRTDIENAIATLNHYLRHIDITSELRIANAIWVDRRYELNDDYVKRCERYLYALAQAIEFSNKQQSANTINQWVNDNTKGKIPSIVDQNMLKDIIVVLSNAVYFKAAWANPFDKDITTVGMFLCSNGSQSPARMMHQTNDYLYAETDSFQLVLLPFKSFAFYVAIALPKPEFSLDYIMQELSQNWSNTIGSTATTKVVLTLPHMKVEYENNQLLRLLSMLGLPITGDYSSTGIIPIEISALCHKAVMEWDEVGAEASAATVMPASAGAYEPPKQAIMTVDRPFYVALGEYGSGSVLFSGLVRHLP